MSRLFQWARDSYARLPSREQRIVLAICAAAMLLLASVICLALSSATASVRDRVATKTSQAYEVGAEAPRYLERKKARERVPRRVQLVPLVERAARGAGVDISQLRPDTSDPNDDGLIESRVDLKIQDISVDRAQAFLGAIEETEGAVIARVSAERARRRAGLHLEVTVKSWHREER